MAPNENLSQQTLTLNNGIGEIPALGFGTSLSDNRKIRDAVKTAVEVGFRHLDAAERYRNEAEVGAALKELFAQGTVCREELFVTTKLWNNNHRPERASPRCRPAWTDSGSTQSICTWCTPRLRSPRATTKIPDTRMGLSSTTTVSRWRRRGVRWNPLSMGDSLGP